MLEKGNERGQGISEPSSLLSKIAKLGLFVALSGGLFYGVLSLVKPQYRSAAQLLIEQAGGKTGTKKALVTDQIKVLHSQKFVQDFIARNNVGRDSEFNGSASRQGPLRRVLIMMGLASNPATMPEKIQVYQAFKNNLSVEEGQKDQTISIAMRSLDPQKSARLANQYATDFIAQLNKQARASRPVPRENNRSALNLLLRQRISAGKSELAALQNDIKLNPFIVPEPQKSEEEIANAEGAPTEKLKLDKDQLFELTTQYILARAEREQIEVRINLVHAMLSSEGEIHGTSTVLNSGMVQRLLVRRSRLERKKSDLEVTLLPSHPQLKRLNRELMALRAQIKSEAQSAVVNLEDEAKVAAAKEKSIKESIDKLQNPVVAVEEKSAPVVVSEPVQIDERLAKLEEVQREIIHNEQQLAGAQAGEEHEVGRVITPAITARMVSKAMAVYVPVFPQKVPMTLLGMLAAFFLGLMALVFSGKNAPVHEEFEEEAMPQKAREPIEDEDILGFGQSGPVSFGTKLLKL